MHEDLEICLVFFLFTMHEVNFYFKCLVYNIWSYYILLPVWNIFYRTRMRYFKCYLSKKIIRIIYKQLIFYSLLSEYTRKDPRQTIYRSAIDESCSRLAANWWLTSWFTCVQVIRRVGEQEWVVVCKKNQETYSCSTRYQWPDINLPEVNGNNLIETVIISRWNTSLLLLYKFWIANILFMEQLPLS